MSDSIESNAGRFDVAIVGAGVVGCALARRYGLAGARIVVIDKAKDILDGASKGNSGILHTGFDAPPGSLELDCIRTGYREYRELHRSLNLPLFETGAYVVAWTEEEEGKLPSLVAKAHANGIANVRLIGREALLSAEPALSRQARSAIYVPGEAVIDPWSAPHAYLFEAMAHGTTLLRDWPVESADFDGRRWTLQGRSGRLEAAKVINAAGLHGDTVETILLGSTDFEIRPRKGQFVVFDKDASRFVQAILLPVPSATTKGIVITRTSYGNVLVGPTSEDQESLTDASTDAATLQRLRAEAVRIVPELRGCGVNAVYAGIRPASDDKVYRIRLEPDRQYLRIGGIRSTGLTAALGIAARAMSIFPVDAGTESGTSPEWRRPEWIAEDGGGTRCWQRSSNGGIVCHCELVTRAEIAAVMDGPVPPKTLAGLKRRTRVMMGRCQGFYCTAEIAEMTAGHFDPPLGESGRSGT